MKLRPGGPRPPINRCRRPFRGREFRCPLRCFPPLCSHLCNHLCTSRRTDGVLQVGFERCFVLKSITRDEEYSAKNRVFSAQIAQKLIFGLPPKPLGSYANPVLKRFHSMFFPTPNHQPPNAPRRSGSEFGVLNSGFGFLAPTPQCLAPIQNPRPPSPHFILATLLPWRRSSR